MSWPRFPELGVDNAVVEIDGPEAPIMDGSAGPFVAAIDGVGLDALDAMRRYIRVLKPVRVALGDAFGEILPNPRGFRIEAEVAFEHKLIGRQSFIVDVKPDTFRREIARARTFGFMRDVTSLWNSGYALGASLENTLVVTDTCILNPEGTGFRDEFVSPARCSVRSVSPRPCRGATASDLSVSTKAVTS